ncbi:unnamed protein product [Brassica oleracea var. botrytis]
MVVSVALMLLAGLRAVQVLVQRSTCSRLFAYRSWFGELATPETSRKFPASEATR